MATGAWKAAAAAKRAKTATRYSIGSEEIEGDRGLFARDTLVLLRYRIRIRRRRGCVLGIAITTKDERASVSFTGLGLRPTSIPPDVKSPDGTRVRYGLKGRVSRRSDVESLRTTDYGPRDADHIPQPADR